MRNRTVITLSAALVLALAVQAGPGYAKTKITDREKAEATRRSLAFEDSGKFSGILGGELILGDSFYKLSPDVRIHELGVGPILPGNTVTDRLIYVTGTTVGTDHVITSIIVRPASETLVESDGVSSNVHVMPNGTPQ